MKKITPIFIFSLPRSGSTLLQRILTSHEKISSVAEPWILLPFVYPLEKHGISSEYSHANMTAALEDFISELPKGEEDYLEAVRVAVSLLYQKAISSSDAKYFLDKTPRYALICGKIIQTFPNAKYIFLWRNPLAVIASMIETWGHGKWCVYEYKIDLFAGLMNLIEAYKCNSEVALSIQYEDFLTGPEEILKESFRYLDIEGRPEVLEEFSSVKMQGRMGDSTGTRTYYNISKEPLEKWKAVLSNPLRKYWCKRYLDWIGDERLSIMGFDYNALLLELKEVPTNYKYFFSDILRMSYGYLYHFVEPYNLRNKLRRLISGESLYAKS